jgi:hypothetical protein
MVVAGASLRHWMATLRTAVRTGSLLLAVAAAVLLPATAFADTTPLTARARNVTPAGAVPEGYTQDAEAAVRWTYPNAAAGDVTALRERAPRAWADLGRRFGIALAPDLDIRVAVNFDDMQALAPAGARLPAYASGVAFPEAGVILLSLTDPRSFRRPDMEGVLVHELSHVGLHRAVAGHPVPRWFTEGVSIHEAGEHSLARIRTLWDGTLRGQLVPFAKLSGAFGAQHGRVDLAYAQSADVVRFLVDGDDPARFPRLITRLREGASFEDAVRDAYGLPLGYIEREWRAAVERRFGRWPSFLAGLASLWALSALLLIVGYVRVRRKHARTLAEWAAAEEAAAAKPPTPPPPPPPAAPTPPTDAILDAIEARRRHDPEIPTVQHDGQNHTLH